MRPTWQSIREFYKLNTRGHLLYSYIIVDKVWTGFDVCYYKITSNHYRHMCQVKPLFCIAAFFFTVLDS